MAKYNCIELNIRDGELLGLTKLRSIEKDALNSKNSVYIYKGTKTQKIYIGQTIHFRERHKQHYSKDKEVFENADFDSVLVIFSKYFNKSALDDVEIQLITYFIADSSNFKKREVEFDREEVINKKRKNTVNEYIGREKVASEVILPLWEDVLYPNQWVNTKTIDELRAKELVKYSPIKILTDEQYALIDEIIQHPQKNYVINGDAGTGKTILLTHLVARLIKENEYNRIGVIVQPNWAKTALEIFKVYGISGRNLTIATSTKLINTHENFDIIIVDESHKLSRKYGKQHPSFNEVYKIAEFANCSSHLEIIKRLGKQIVLMYDVLQAIRPANITRDMFKDLTEGYEKRFLATQFRIQTSKEKNYTSDDYVDGVKYLLYKDTGLLESEFTSFNSNFNRDVFRDKEVDAYFGYFTEQPLHQLIDWIEEDNNFNPEHINRILAGLVEPWTQSDGKDINKKHWHEGEIHRRWNSTQENWLNSKDLDAEEQIGSVFAVQGLDLNKVGVLIGNDIQVNEFGQLEGNPKGFLNTNGIFTQEEMEIQENKDEFTLLVLNSYYVLMTRGIDGIRLGFWYNDQFRKYMEKTLDILN